MKAMLVSQYRHLEIADRPTASDPQHIEHVLRRVETEVGKLYTHDPESIYLNETALKWRKWTIAWSRH